MRGNRAAIRLVALVVPIVGAAFACLAPTQVTLQLTTDVDCGVVRQFGTSIHPGDPAGVPSVSTTRECAIRDARGELGSLVLTPSGEKDDRLFVAVVLGVKRPSDECATNGYRGCIVAKRRFRFVPHEPLDMPIDLALSCLDIACSPDETCFRGACISADVVAKSGCLGPDCDARAASLVDASPAEGGATSDAIVATDGGPIVRDAAFDATPTTLHETPLGRPRAVVLRNGTLFWTEFDTLFANTALKSLVLQTGAESVVASFVNDATGLDTSANEYVVGRNLAPGYACATRAAFDGGSWRDVFCPDAGSFNPTVGVAARFGAQDTLVLARVADTVRFIGDASTALPGGGGYVEGDDAGAYFVSGTELVRVDWAGFLAKQVVTALPRTAFGLALSSTHWFVGTSDGEITVISRAAPANHYTLLPPGSLSDMEDLAYDEATRTLYIAGNRAGAFGIYTIAGFDPALHP